MSKLVESAIIEILKKVRDPELNGNVVELGLIRSINIDNNRKIVEIKWIPTSPICPLVLVISAVMRYAILKKLEMGEWDVRIMVDESVPTASFWNSQLSDPSNLDKIIVRLQDTGQINYFISE